LYAVLEIFNFKLFHKQLVQELFSVFISSFSLAGNKNYWFLMVNGHCDGCYLLFMCRIGVPTTRKATHGVKMFFFGWYRSAMWKERKIEKMRILV
jgi:hypothetical protein